LLDREKVCRRILANAANHSNWSESATTLVLIGAA
jgi:hypothetical protein